MAVLWIAIDLPLLPLEAHPLRPSPSAVGELHRLVVCDAAASEAGLRPGMGIAAARALLPMVQVMARDAARERAMLERLACWAGSLTPQVSVVIADAASNDRHALLLDIGACLRLFGGLETILSRVHEGLREQGVTAQFAVAPIAQAALWLARVDSKAVCMERDAMHDRLKTLPLDVLPPRAAATLRSFGMRTLGDVRVLPGAALARRLDAHSLHVMARAFGDLPDPRSLFVFPQQFSMALELPAAVETTDQLLFAAHRLVAALEGWLAARQAGVLEFTLHLRHRNATTPLVMRFAGLTRDRVRIERVLREKLQRMMLVAPVESLQLEATQVDVLPGQSVEMFDSAAGKPGLMGELMERLRARLGEQQVFGLVEVADHRPELATQQAAKTTTSGATGCSGGGKPRPFWLLQTPKALTEIDGFPFHRGPLRLLAGPERIESGWWSDGAAAGIADIRRDYFVALSDDSRWLWIYRECRFPGGWFLHGLFA